MLQKIHRWLTYAFAILFTIFFLTLLVLAILFLVGMNSLLDIIFIPFDLLEAFPYIYLLPMITLPVAIALLIKRRRPYVFVSILSGLTFIVAAVIYRLYLGAESAMMELVGLAGSAFAYSLAMIFTIITAYIISGDKKR